jgi:argininosuccinate lyase
MLTQQKLLSKDDCAAICDGLKKLGEQFHAGDWHIELADEDVHTALETRLTSAIGDAGGRLHLGRSRNDQVLTALRLYLRDAADQVQHSVRGLLAALADLQKRQGEVTLPGYTHMQQAMPSSVDWWAGGFAEAFDDALAGLSVSRRRMNKNPLGSAAGYGTPGLALDREFTTAALGFDETQNPVTAVQISRGKAEAGLLFELTLLMQDLARLAADLLLFYTQEFSYIALADDVTTGSSIMPQKRNPDVLELVRGASATVNSCLQECLLLVAKLPSGFQRDTQRIKAPLFRGIDLTIDSVDVMAYLISRMQFNPDKIKLDDGLYAAERAYALVTNDGIPFRDAYRRVAKQYGAKAGD